MFRNLVFIAVISCASLFAQQAGQPSSVQQTTQRQDAATYVATSATSAATITVVVPANQYFYLTGVDIQNCAGASAVTAAAPTTITTTGFANGGPSYTVGSGVTAGLCTNQTVSLGTPLKSSSPGTNATFVIPTFATNQTIRLNVYGYFGQ